MEIAYLLIAVLGLVGTWYFNLLWFLTVDSPPLSETMASPLVRSIVIDLWVVLLTFLVWLIPEARRLKIRHWWVIVVLRIFVAFAYPLFMFLRERKLRQLAN